MRYVTFFTLLCVLLSFQFSPAQAPDTLWTKTFRAAGRCVIETSDSGLVVVGGKNGDVYLLKTDRMGDSLWSKMYGGSGYDYGSSVQQTLDGGYIITGSTNSFNLGDDDVFIIKTNEVGDTMWTKVYGGNDGDWGNEVQQTSDGGYIITGVTGMTNEDDHDIWLIKTDPAGDILWTKIFGDSLRDRGRSVQQTVDEGFILTGEANGEGWGIRSAFLYKTNSSGDTIWATNFWEGGDFYGECVRQTNDGGYIVTGATQAPSYDVWLVKINSLGHVSWRKNYGTTEDEGGSCVLQSMDEGYVVVGRIYGGTIFDLDVWLIKTNSFGDMMWSKTFGGSGMEGGWSVYQTFDAGYIICATGESGIWLIKTAADPMSIDQIETSVISEFSLSQNYPNPFNPSTTIEFDLPKSSKVTLKIFNILGEEVTRLVSARLSAGSYSYEWDASKLASGVYIYRLQAGKYVETRKMVFMR